MAVKSQIDTLEAVVGSIKNLLSKVEVKELVELDPKKVTNYSLVTVEDKDGEEKKYYLQIPFISLHSKENIITASPESPVGKALLGAEVGETINIDLPNNKQSFKVLGIQKI
jgi:transcription elongation factor GreA